MIENIRELMPFYFIGKLAASSDNLCPQERLMSETKTTHTPLVIKLIWQPGMGLKEQHFYKYISV